MTSPTLDLDGIKLTKSPSSKMDSLDVDVISDSEWKQFAYNMEIFDLVRMSSKDPKFSRQFLSSNRGIQIFFKAAKLGKIDMMEALLRFPNLDVNKIDYAGQTALHYATREGHLDIVGMLLENWKIDASLCDGDGNTTLHIAAKYGHLFILDMLLKVPKLDVNSTNGAGKTALILAAERGHERTVDMLLKVPNLVITSPNHKSTPLHAASEHGRVVIVKKLLEIMDVNSTNHSLKQSSLHLAIKGGHENVVDMLLKTPTIKPFLKDSLGDTPLHNAAEKGNGEIVMKLLQMREVDVNGANNLEMTALHLAALNKHASIVINLLQEPNVDPCPKTKDETTPLHMAAMSGGVDVVEVLVKEGNIDVNTTNLKKHTALYCATEKGHLNVVEVLLKVPNVAPCLGDHNEDTLLHLAAKLRFIDIVERLLTIPHFDVNKVNKQNETPLVLAARFESVNVVDFLLENPNIDISICDKDGNSSFHAAVKSDHANIAKKLITHPSAAVLVHSIKEALHLCIRGGHENLVDILLKHTNLDANAKDAYGNFPIHYAAQMGNIYILQKILNAPGVDVNSANDHQDTALHIFVRAGHNDFVDLLLQVPTLNTSMRDQDGNSAFHIAAKYDEEEIIENLLISSVIDADVENDYGVSAQVLAAEEGHGYVFDKFLKMQGVPIRNVEEDQGEPSRNDWKIRSLLVAAQNGHDNIIKSLLAYGIDVNVIDEFDGPALSKAIEYGHTKVVEVLLNDPKIDPNKRNKKGEHPLFIAARGGQKTIIEKLMATRKIDVNVFSTHETALHGAARNGREQVVNILLTTFGIDVHAKNPNGETALFSAARANNKTILKDVYKASKINIGSEELIIQTQLNINDVNNKGESLIHLAARKNLLNVIDFLLEVIDDDANSVNADLKTSPPKGKDDEFIPQSALQIAIKKQNYAIVEKLTKFESIILTQEEDGMAFLQQIFEQKQWKTFNILKGTPEVSDYIDALSKERQASIDAANAILVGAALIASITFASWLQPPLGYATYYHEQFSDSLPAPPIAYPEYAAFDHHPSLQAFWVFNSLSFFSAIATVISGARSVLPIEEVFIKKKLYIKEEVENLRWNLLRTSILLGFSMFFVLLAFAIVGIVVLPPMMKFRANIFSTIGIGGSVCLMFLFSFGKNICKLLSNIKSSQQRNQIG